MDINKSKIGAMLRFVQSHGFKVFCGGFIFYLFFCGDYSIVSLVSLRNQESALRHEIKEYKDSIANFEHRIEELDVNNEELERYARERMQMHRENEDVYLLDE